LNGGIASTNSIMLVSSIAVDNSGLLVAFFVVLALGLCSCSAGAPSQSDHPESCSSRFSQSANSEKGWTPSHGDIFRTARPVIPARICVPVGFIEFKLIPMRVFEPLSKSPIVCVKPIARLRAPRRFRRFRPLQPRTGNRHGASKCSSRTAVGRSIVDRVFTNFLLLRNYLSISWQKMRRPVANRGNSEIWVRTYLTIPRVDG
jgi:hypothetical protein